LIFLSVNFPKPYPLTIGWIKTFLSMLFLKFKYKITKVIKTWLTTID
jgi:hypothetical protein